MAMKRTELVALSRAAVQRAKSNKVGIIGMTKMQLEKLAEHKKKKEAKKSQVVDSHRAAS
jgi:hypothetical protein